MAPFSSWLYHYGVGALVMVVSLVVLGRVGAWSPRRPTEARLVATMFGCLLIFATVHLAWTWAATR